MSTPTDFQLTVCGDCEITIRSREETLVAGGMRMCLGSLDYPNLYLLYVQDAYMTHGDWNVPLPARLYEELWGIDDRVVT